MPSCVEVALLRLRKASSTEELEKNETHREAIATVTAQPNNLGCTWAVLSEDPTMLIWLVDWVTMEDHTQGFMNADIYKPFEAKMGTLLDEKQPIVYMTHYEFTRSPGKIASALRPTLEILQFAPKPNTSWSDMLQAFSGVTDVWKQTDRPYILAPALDADFKDQRILMIAAWKDIADHKAAKQNPEYYNKFIPCKQHFQDVQLFGHITPIYAPPRQQQV